MKARLFNRTNKQDMDQLNQWHMGERVSTGGMLPQLGWIVDNVAATFLFRTDAPDVVIIDQTISNPSLEPMKRARGVAVVFKACTDYIKAHDMKIVMTLTASDALRKCAERYGCVTDNKLYQVHYWLNPKYYL